MIVRINTADGTSIPFEIGEAAAPHGEGGLTEAGFADAFEVAAESAFGVLEQHLEALARQFRPMVDKLAPDTFTLQVGFKYSGKVGFVVASATAGAEITVSCQWNSDEKRHAER